MRYLSFKLLNCTSSLYILHTGPLCDTYIICKYMYPLIFKFDLCHFIVSVLTFGDWKKSKEDIHLYQKKGKDKNNVQRFCIASCYGKDVHSKQREWHCQDPSPATTRRTLASSCISLNCVCDYLCFIFFIEV